MSRGPIVCLVLSALMSARVSAAEDPFQAERRAALAQMAWVEQAYAERLGTKGSEWRVRVDKEEPALVSTLDWFSRNAEGDQALRLAVPLAYFWNYEGRSSESRELLTRILALPSAAAPTAVRAKALHDAATLAYNDRDQSPARTLDEESLRIYRRLQDDGGMATALLGLSRVALREMDYASARRYAEESGVLRRDIGDKVGQANAIHMLAAVARIQGQYDKAAELYQFSLDANREAGWEAPVAAELFNLGFVRLRQGNIAASKRLFTESLQQYRDMLDEAGIAYVLTGFASVAVEQKQPARAARLYASALGILDHFNVVFDPDDQLDIDHYTATLLTLLSPAAFRTATADGEKLSPDRAIALALETP
jgi:tetratricopeptide (TPR) repeat protein